MAEDISQQAARPPKVLVTLTGGGFLWEAKSLIKAMGPQYEFHYVTTPDSGRDIPQDLPLGELHVIAHVTTLSDRSFWKKAQNVLAACRDAFLLIRKVRPDAVIGVGTSISVPLLLWGRLFGCRTVFVESITRVSNPSLTGKILANLHLCSRLYVQWPEAEKLYRGAICRGTVL